jgi:ribosomal protein S4
MSNTLYKPRLKKGILGNKCFVLSTKNFKNLKKRKWRVVSKTFVNSSSSDSLIRNDVHLIQNKTFDLRRSYKKALLCKQQTSAFFSTFSKKDLRNIFSSKLGIKSACDLLEMRLDMVLFRSNLVKTLHQARWCITSGFISVNNTPVRTINYKLNVGDLVRIKHKEKFFFNSRVFSPSSDYLEVNFDILSVVIVNYPSLKNKKEMTKLYHFFFGLEEIANFNRMN